MKTLSRGDKVEYWTEKSGLTKGEYLEEKEGKHAVMKEETGEIEIIEREWIYTESRLTIL